ncbi:MAG: SIR2 family protein [Chloroflexota bacterium]|nr:SIR2 family protein [Chloroflexota bacterium]
MTTSVGEARYAAEDLVPRLVSEFGYSPELAEEAARELSSADPGVMRAFWRWWNTGELDDSLVIEGYTVRRLMEERQQQPVAAFRLLAWIAADPAIALRRLRRRRERAPVFPNLVPEAHREGEANAADTDPPAGRARYAEDIQGSDDELDLRGLAEHTAQLLADGTITIFLGAGASAGTEEEQKAGKGAPSTSDLKKAIIELAGLPETDLKRDLDVVASSAVAALGDDTQVRAMVAQHIGRDTAILRAHKALAALPLDVLMTTNYDHRYEEALAAAKRPYVPFVRDADLARTSPRATGVYKLHGDIDDPPTMVLTAQDYEDWEFRAGGMIDAAVARLQAHPCVFVGYKVGDRNFNQLLARVRHRLGEQAHRHYSVVRTPDPDAQVRLSRHVQFVQGDATEFLELVQQLWEERQPTPSDIPAASERLEELKRNREWDAAARACCQLANGLLERRQPNSAAGEWRRLADAAAEDGHPEVAARAYLAASKAYLEGYDEPEAEWALDHARELAIAAELPDVASEAEPLLLRARQARGNLRRRLETLEEVLASQGEGGTVESRYALRTSRALIRELLDEEGAAIDDLRGALAVLPEDAGYPRAEMRAALARMLMLERHWDEARHVLDDGVSELERLENAPTARTKDARALLDLARANLHYELGEFPEAFPLYLEAGRAFEETDYALAITAWQGVWNTGRQFGRMFVAARERVRDFMRLSAEHEEIGNATNRGIAHLAAGQLPGAMSDLTQALEAAHAQHNIPTARTARRWLGRVLVEGERPLEGLAEIVLGGDKEEAQKLASDMGAALPPPGSEGFASLLSVASEGDMSARGAALVALRAAADFLPDEQLDALVALLARMHELPSLPHLELREDAAALARRFARRLGDDQARAVVESLISCVVDAQANPFGRRAACSALAAFIDAHPALVSAVEMPVSRLVELCGGEQIERDESLAALVALGAAGHDAAREQALALLRESPAFEHLVWRTRLDDVSEEEILRRVREFLGRPADRVEVEEGAESFAFTGNDHSLLLGLRLPDRSIPDVASSLIDTVSDSRVAARARGVAARVLGDLAERLGKRERMAAIERLQEVVAGEIESHYMARNTADPLSVLQNRTVGNPEEVAARAMHALLVLSPSMRTEQRGALRTDIERLRTGRLRSVGIGIASGLRHFVPSDVDERAWLETRLLLLLNSEHAGVREAAAASTGRLIVNGVLPYNPELQDISRALATSKAVEDRRGAALMLKGMVSNDAWTSPVESDLLAMLAGDASFSVRQLARDEGAPS